MSRQSLKRLTSAAIASVAILGGGIAAAAPASASGPGYCTINNACLSYDSNNTGANYGIDADYSSLDYMYFGKTAVSTHGSGVGVHDGASSAANFNAAASFCVYFHTNWWGPYDSFAAYGSSGYSGNLLSTYKNDASTAWSIPCETTG